MKINKYKILPVIATVIIILVILILHNVNTADSSLSTTNSDSDFSSGSGLNSDSDLDSDSSLNSNSNSGTDSDSDANLNSNSDSSNHSSDKDLLTSETTSSESETTTTSGIHNGTDKITIAFAGDILLADNLYASYQANGVAGFLSETVSNQLKNADLTFINQEFPFSNRGTPEPNKEYTYCVAPERVQVFLDMGVDVVSISNNHILDYGQDALVDTFSVLENAGIDYVGAGSDLDRAKQLIIKEVNGKKIGFLAASRVVPSESWYARNATDTHAARPGVFTAYDDTAMCEEITKAKQICDFVVVYAHWGIERQETAAQYQRTMAHRFVDAGADLIVGSHPHVMQGVEFYKDVPIVYSLGNFLFSNYYSRTTVLTCTIQNDNTCSIEFLPCGSQTYYTSELSESGIPGFYDFLNQVSFGVTFSSDGTFTYTQVE